MAPSVLSIQVDTYTDVVGLRTSDDDDDDDDGGSGGCGSRAGRKLTKARRPASLLFPVINPLDPIVHHTMRNNGQREYTTWSETQSIYTAPADAIIFSLSFFSPKNDDLLLNRMMKKKWLCLTHLHSYSSTWEVRARVIK